MDFTLTAASAAAKSLQSCPTLCDPIDSNPPGSPVPGILQTRTREWVAISFSNAWKWKVKVKSLSRVWPSATPWTAAYQAPPSMGFSRQEYWSGIPLPSPLLWLLFRNLTSEYSLGRRIASKRKGSKMPDPEWQRQPTYEFSIGSWILMFQETHGSYKVALNANTSTFLQNGELDIF